MRIAKHHALSLLLAGIAILGLTGCPASQDSPAQAAANQAALAPRVVQLPNDWPIPELRPPAALQQVKLTPQLLAAIAARAGSTPAPADDGYELAGLPYREMQEDAGLAGISGGAMATDAPDATDRARPDRKGQYWLIACTGAADWEELTSEMDAALTAAGYRRIEGSDGPEGAVARFIDGDETRLAALVHRVPRPDHRERGLREEFIFIACTLEKRQPRNE